MANFYPPPGLCQWGQAASVEDVSVQVLVRAVPRAAGTCAAVSQLLKY